MATKRRHSSESESSIDLDQSQRGYESDDEGGVRIDDIYIPPPPRPPGTIDPTGPRLIITRIVNTNFKSYGGERVLGPFHKNFNAIVGPNGSGKSNVIDSMLFVFGYRASKIRSKKLSVLIHKSSTHPNLQSASVAIHFTLINDKEDDPDAYEEIPDKKFAVSRVVHKDNSSYYLLNNSRVQYKEIASLLRKYGIDLDHNRFLILQGEVEQISLMKPKAPTEHDTGMLEYLEDIIGTTRFKEPLKQIDERIEVLSQLREEKLKRVHLAEKEKDALREPMQEAVQFLEVENNVMKKRNFLYQRQIKHLNEKIISVDAEMNELTEKETELKESLKTISEEKKIKETAFSEKHKKYEDLTKKKEDLTETFDKANNRDINLQADFQEINKRRKKVIELLKEERAKLEELEKIPQRNKDKIEEYEAREVKLTTQCETLQAEKEGLLARVREETLGLQEKKEKVQTELIGLKNAVDETKQALNLAESEIKIFTSNEENERRKFETLKTTFEENKQKLSERSKSLKEVKQRLPALEKQYETSKTSLGRVKIEEARVINEIKVQRVQVEETRSSMQASRSRGRVLDSLMQQKNEGKLPGLFGRLGDLGAIDQRYDVAVSTACGALDNIVVDKVDTAQWCIEFLREHNIGRATLIALDKQEHLRNLATSKIKTPENVPRLYDLIKVEDDRVRTAFYYALRDTLVANDIDQGTRIAYGERRYRVVTLKGELIETSGTMSGGGRTVLRGRMGQKVAVTSAMSPQKVNDMEKSLTRLENKAQELREKQTALEDEVNRLEPELRALNIDLEKFSMEVLSLQQQQPKLEKQIKTQERVVKESCVNPAQLKKMQAAVEAKRVEYEKANSNSEVLQKKVDEITKEIKDKIDRKIKPVNNQLKDSTTMLEKIKAELVKLKVAIKTSERNSKKSKDKINNMEQEKTEAENKLHGIQKERKEIEADAAKLMELIQDISDQLGEGQNKFSDEQKEIASLSKKINALKSDKIELDQKINEISKSLEESRYAVARTEKKLSSLQLHEIPEQPVEELRKYTDEELENTDTARMEVELKREEEEIKTARPNLTAIKEFKKKEAHYIERVNELEEATQKRKQMKDLREDLRKKRQKEFHAGFNLISTKLKEMYQLITLGGDAELEMVDSYDPFSEGIILNVRPPKKSWKNITNLSGGEKTLSSLALVFALHYYKPSPLYFMDEIDAALDFKNVSIVGNYIKERTKNAQFIIISLRSNMFELADHLVGIYKTYDITKSVTINPRHFDDQKPKESAVRNSQLFSQQIPATNPNITINTQQSDPASLFTATGKTASQNTSSGTGDSAVGTIGSSRSQTISSTDNGYGNSANEISSSASNENGNNAINANGNSADSESGNNVDIENGNNMDSGSGNNVDNGSGNSADSQESMEVD